MIITHTASGSTVAIRQTDHARTCHSAARAWRRPSGWAQKIWERFILAVGKHDDGWTDTERQPAIDPDGQPHDFKSIPTAQHVTIWRRTIDLAMHDDPYQGLLVALHARWLYTNLSVNHDNPQAANRFINETSLRIDDAISTIRDSADPAECDAIEPTNLKQAQRLLAFFDALSLMLLEAVPWQPMTQPICFDDTCQALVFTGQPDTSDPITVDPWPWTNRMLTLHTKAHVLSKTHFKSSDDLAQHLAAGPRIDIDWVLAPSNQGT